MSWRPLPGIEQLDSPRVHQLTIGESSDQRGGCHRRSAGLQEWKRETGHTSTKIGRARV